MCPIENGNPLYHFEPLEFLPIRLEDLYGGFGVVGKPLMWGFRWCLVWRSSDSDGFDIDLSRTVGKHGGEWYLAVHDCTLDAGGGR